MVPSAMNATPGSGVSSAAGSQAGAGLDQQGLARVAELLRAAMRVVRGGQVAEWTDLDLTMAQVKVLFLLHHEGPLRTGHIAARLDVKLPTVTSTVDGLVKRGLVQREDDPHDRRIVIVRLTPEGGALMERLQQGRQARIVALLAQMQPPSRGR
jgi:DNA-binding MarR family transcriptional regulator